MIARIWHVTSLGPSHAQSVHKTDRWERHWPLWGFGEACPYSGPRAQCRGLWSSESIAAPRSRGRPVPSQNQASIWLGPEANRTKGLPLTGSPAAHKAVECVRADPAYVSMRAHGSRYDSMRMRRIPLISELPALGTLVLASMLLCSSFSGRERGHLPAQAGNAWLQPGA
jgi:hypothetical protein